MQSSDSLDMKLDSLLMDDDYFMDSEYVHSFTSSASSFNVRSSFSLEMDLQIPTWKEVDEDDEVESFLMMSIRDRTASISSLILSSINLEE